MQFRPNTSAAWPAAGPGIGGWLGDALLILLVGGCAAGGGSAIMIVELERGTRRRSSGSVAF